MENDLHALLSEVGRLVLEWAYNQVEPEATAHLPSQVQIASDTTFPEGGQRFRRNRKTRRSWDTLFGQVTVRRWWYQNTEPGEAGCAPLELALGVGAAAVTPALAQRLGRLMAEGTQQQTRDALAEHYHVRLSVKRLRQATAALAEGLEQHRQAVQVAALQEWLAEAEQTTGDQPIVVAAGRDGVMIPMRCRGGKVYEEAGCGTVSVYGRDGKRRGTVYLGQMPQSGQAELTAQMNGVLDGLLGSWEGALPRLEYLTDAGTHPQNYFHDVLAQRRHPRSGERLRWSWTVDYYHACQYVSDLGEALFGAGEAAWSWSAKQRRVLRDKPNGAARVLQSAQALRRRRGLKRSAKAFTTAANYLRHYGPHMNYARRRAQGLPIGSGVTEAGCKTIFTQRFKQSGMRWDRTSGGHVLTLRLLVKSQIYPAAYRRHLQAAAPRIQPTSPANHASNVQIPNYFTLPA